MPDNYFKIKFSIAIPVTDFQFLDAAIKSCLNQTFKEFEIIVLNNAKDNLTKIKIEEIVKYYMDDRISYYQNENQIPLVPNWNKCLSLSKGEFFCILSDDDLLEKTYLESFLTLAYKYPNANVFHCRIRKINEYNEFISFGPSCPEYEDVLNFIWHRINGFRCQYISDFLYNRAILESKGGFINTNQTGWGTDDLTAFLIAKENGVVFINKPLLNYREHLNNLTFSSDSIAQKLEANLFYFNWLVKLLAELQLNSDFDKELMNDTISTLQIWYENRVKDLFDISKISIIKLVSILLKINHKKRLSNLIISKIIFKGFFKK